MCSSDLNEHPSKQAKVRTIKPKKVKEPIMEKQPKPPKATTPNRQLFANEDFVSSGSHADKKEDHILCTTFSLLGARRMIKLLRNYECHDFTEPFEENGMFKFYYKNK